MEFTELAMRMFGSGAVMLLCIWIGGFNEWATMISLSVGSIHPMKTSLK
jgi:hypothetical protein